MRKLFTLLTTVLLLQLVNAQTTATFEDFNLSSESFLNNGTPDGGFENGNIFLHNTYHPSWDGWDGWAISNTTDTQTPGFMNQFSSIVGKGVDDSDTYAVTFVLGKSLIELRGEAIGGIVEGFHITNSTYAYLSILEGDSFTKKFGGETGDDPDFFLLTIKKYFQGNLSTDSIDFYLADYRFADNTQDYIVDEWHYIDLTSLGNVDSLQVTLSSTDNGTHGMNTPAYFCMDNLTTRDLPTSTFEVENNFEFEVFPNPASDWLLVNWKGSNEAILSCYDVNGVLKQNWKILPGLNEQNISDLPKGMYFLDLNGSDFSQKTTFVKF